MAYGNGLFVATDIINARVMTSPDGITWTASTNITGTGWRSVVYGDGRFTAVGYEVGIVRVATSTDGITWLAQTPATTGGLSAVCYGNRRYVALVGTGSFAGSRVITSPDGSTWTARNGNEIDGEVSVAYGNGVFVAVSGYGTNRVMTSSPSNAAAALTNWAASQGITGTNALPTATPFNDGVSNLLKYAFNMPLVEPRSNALDSIVGPGANGLPVFTVSPTGPNPSLTAKFLRRRNSGLNYVPQLGTSLGNFTPMTGPQTVTPIDAEWKLVTVVEPLGTPTPSTAFSRVSVSLP